MWETKLYLRTIRLTFTVPWTGVNNFGCTGLDISWACKSPCSDSWIALYVSDLAGSYCTVFLILKVEGQKRGGKFRGGGVSKEMCEEEYIVKVERKKKNRRNVKIF